MNKNSISRRSFLKLALTMTGGVIVARCTPAQQATPQQPAGSQPQATPTPTTAMPVQAPASDATYEEWINTVASEEPIEVRFVHWFDPNTPGENNQALLDFATSEWKKRYPNGKINWELVGWGEIDQKTPGFIMANEAVDVSYNWGGATENWCSADLILPLNNRMPKWWVDQRVPDILKPPSNALCSDGRLAMATFGLENQCVVIRKDLLEQAGVDGASMASFQGLLDGLKKISAISGFEKPYGLKLGADWSAMDSINFAWLGNGITFGEFREDGSEKDAWIEAAALIKGLMELSPEACLNWTWAETEQSYCSGQIAAMDHGNWFYSVGKSLDPEGKIVNPDTTTLLPYPYGNANAAKKPFYTFSNTGFYLLKTSSEKNQQAAIDLMAILSNTRTVWLHSDGTNPATTDGSTEERLQVAQDKDIGWWWDAWDNVKKNAENISIRGFVARDEITGAAFPLLVSMFRGELTPDQLYERVREVALPLIQAARGG